ncbi:MAG: ABC transporter permease subunit/CPBP intramembrane protease [Planctomycetota bacterium]
MTIDSKQKRLQARLANRPKWQSIGLIYAREMRDQLRDRRTLFTIIVLPIMLYPVVGMLLMQMAQFTRAHTTSVCILGVEQVTASDDSTPWRSNTPPLLRRLDADAQPNPTTAPLGGNYEFLPDIAGEQKNLALFGYPSSALGEPDEVARQVTSWVRDGVFDCVLDVRAGIGQTNGSPAATTASDQTAGKLPGEPDTMNLDATDVGSVKVFFNIASDPSMVARGRIESVLNRWRGTWVRDRLHDAGVELSVLDPFQIQGIDIAPKRTRETAFWSKILPFIMLVWAMTGAFYPAIDLVAGEKERGTLETLLCSPALRSEIVWGKLGAVMSFSMLTAVLNAVSMLLTSVLVFQQMGIGPGGTSMGTPPLAPMLWLLVALVPLSALFSALALAVAAMARSSKEGQYYLMPLMMMTLPLVMLPMLPGMVLSVGTSLIPVTGMFLLVRSLIEGHFADALLHLPIVVMVTGLCLTTAMRWAQRQFETESVLFGDGDHWELGAWMRHLWQDRQRAATPTLALACGVIVLVGLFFGKLVITEIPQSMSGLSRLIFFPQIGLILAPTLLMATMMTTSLKSSLRINSVPWRLWPIIALLGFTLHPLHVQLATWISTLYPLSPEAIAAMTPFANQLGSANWLGVLFLMAVVPAVCEELTFRGFIFGGLARNQSPLRAILVTAIMFGISHGVLQQSITATIVGLLLGWIALRTGSVLPGILIHLTLNGMSVSMERIADLNVPVINQLIYVGADGAQYLPLYSAMALIFTMTCLLSLYRRTQGTGSIHPLDRIADRVSGPRPVVDPAVTNPTV